MSKETEKAFCEANLYECCDEILEFRSTGILRDGKVRLLAKLMSERIGEDDIRTAEDLVYETAMKKLTAEDKNGVKLWSIDPTQTKMSGNFFTDRMIPIKG